MYAPLPLPGIPSSNPNTSAEVTEKLSESDLSKPTASLAFRFDVRSYSNDKFAKYLFVFVVPCVYANKLAGFTKVPPSKSGSLGQVGFAEKAAPKISPL